MGNYNEIIARIDSGNTTPKSCNFLHKRKKKSRRPKSKDNFFVEYTHFNKSNDTLISASALDQRRTVFVSVLGLFNTWQSLPSHTLYTSIFILPLKEKWIYNPDKYSDQIKQNPISHFTALSDIVQTQKFIELLRWKNSQGLIFWTLNDYECPQSMKLSAAQSLIAPFWYNLSAKLSDLYNPITGKKYKPLNFDTKYWHSRETFVSKFDNSTIDVLSELYFVQAEFDTICEILFQSNPLSLNPIKSYQKLPIPEFVHINGSIVCDLFEEFDSEECMEDWCISEEYNPYHLD